MCAKAGALAYVSADYWKLVMWCRLLAGGSGSAHMWGVLRATPLFIPGTSQYSMWVKASTVCLTLHLMKKQHRALTDPLPLISNHVVWLMPGARHQIWWSTGLFSCMAPVFLCNTALCVCLLCSLVELEKEVNNIKTGLKAVEAVSIWRFPNCHTENISLRIMGPIYLMIRECGLSFYISSFYWGMAGCWVFRMTLDDASLTYPKHSLGRQRRR